MENHLAEELSFCINFIGYVGMVAGKPKLTTSESAGHDNGNEKSSCCYISGKRLNSESAGLLEVCEGVN